MYSCIFCVLRKNAFRSVGFYNFFTSIYTLNAFVIFIVIAMSFK